MKQLELKPRKVIDIVAIRRRKLMKENIGKISDIAFTPVPESEYKQLPEPFRSEALAQFAIRKDRLAFFREARVQTLKANILQYGYELAMEMDARK